MSSRFAREAADKFYKVCCDDSVWFTEWLAEIIDTQYAPLIAAIRKVSMVRNSLASRNQLNRAIGRLCRQLALHDQETTSKERSKKDHDEMIRDYRREM
jgi:hypothetical protein